jgi:hypothetical protein
MITKCPGGFTLLVLSVISTTVFGGVIGGGSGPPAKEALEQMLLARELGSAGLFLNEEGNVGLGVNRPLGSDLVLTRSRVTPQALSMSATDFETLANSRVIDAVSIGFPDSETKSYRVDEGNLVDEIVLRDRRELARNSIK